MSGVRLVHIPTGLTVTINGRDFHKNRQEAREKLTLKLKEYYAQLEADSLIRYKATHLKSGHRGEKIRTYNFIESRATDHRTGKKINNLKALMKGEFNLLR